MFIILFILSLSHIGLKAQNQLDWLIKNSDFKPVLASHFKEVNMMYKSGTPIVSVVLFKPDTDEGFTVYLSAISNLAEVKDHLPASFTTIDKQPFLIYDGSEQLITDKDRWFESVRAFIGKRLCDDLRYRELLKQPGPRELTVPCGTIYDATTERLLFKEGKLVKRTLAGTIPY